MHVRPLDVSSSLTTEEASGWLTGDAQENRQILTDYEIVEAIEAEVEGEGAGSLRSISANEDGGPQYLDAFKIAMKWAEENDLSANELIMMKRVQDRAVKASS